MKYSFANQEANSFNDLLAGFKKLRKAHSCSGLFQISFVVVKKDDFVFGVSWDVGSGEVVVGESWVFGASDEVQKVDFVSEAGIVGLFEFWFFFDQQSFLILDEIEMGKGVFKFWVDGGVKAGFVLSFENVAVASLIDFAFLDDFVDFYSFDDF